MTDVVLKAFKFASEKHEGQKYGDDIYMIHPILVMMILETINYDDRNLLAAAYLHDTLEDTDTSYEELIKEFNQDVADLVVEVTKSDNNTFAIKTQRGAMLKFADRLANISNMEGWTEERKNKYIFEKSKFWK